MTYICITQGCYRTTPDVRCCVECQRGGHTHWCDKRNEKADERIDPVTLDDLRIGNNHPWSGAKATLDDYTQVFSGLSADEQVQVLEGMGAKRVTIGYDYHGSKVSPPINGGRYLVLPLPTPKKKDRE